MVDPMTVRQHGCHRHRDRALVLWAARCAVWLIALGYLLIEALEAVTNRQIINLAIFATLYALATYQLSTARLLFSMRRMAGSARACRASNRMFLAALLAIGDAAQDALAIPLAGPTQGAWLLPILFALGLIFNLVAVVMAIWSLELYLPMLVAGLTFQASVVEADRNS